VISVTELGHRFGAKILFEKVSLQFNPGCHYGLVGANGCGKSTFLKILSGEISAEKGTIQIPAQSSVGSLKQDHYLYEEEKILDVVLMGKPKLWQALVKQNQLLSLDHFSEEECEELAAVEKIISEQDGYAAGSEAAKLLEGLGIREEWHEKPLKLLSGGYKLRVLLAQLFFGKPEILLLDEPTNHLDIFSIKWLQGYLRDFPGMLLLSSHDREFLNAVCTHIADVDYKTIKIYKGNYDDFLELKKEEREQKEAILHKQERRRSEIQEFVDRFGAKASKARQAQSKARMVEKLTDEIESLDFTPSSRLYPKIRFDSLRPSGAIPLVVKEISKSYGPKKVLEKISFEIEKGERLAIIGPNGIGKSTLLEILTGNRSADHGSFDWGFAVRLAYFPQDHTKEVQGKISLLDWLGNLDRSLSQEQLREVLGRVLFSGDAVHQLVETLSGGETARLILAKMMLQHPNVLIFDEPTNHLDMEAIDELTRALKNFDGTLIFVSHNRYFVSQIATSILEITREGMKMFRCSYEEYLEKQEKDHLSTQISLRQRYKEEEAEAKTASAPSIPYEEQKRMRNAKAQIKKRIDEAEKECSRLEKAIEKLNNIMGSPDFYEKTGHEEQQRIIKEKAQLEKDLEQAMEAWEKASLEL
jgi:ATPase subunit of ABC transporter with duplicated ATPase domains